MFLDAESRSINNNQLEKQVKSICEQLKVQQENTYKDLSIWLKNGTAIVPTWMYNNPGFISALKLLRTTEQYIKLLKTFGRHYIVNQAQCSTILNAINMPEDEISRVKKVITKFWAESTTAEIFKKDNWEGFKMIESSLILGEDHPLLYTLDKNAK